MKTLAVFGIFEAGMPAGGLLLGRSLAGTVGIYSRYVGAGILALAGGYVLWKAIRTGAADSRSQPDPDADTKTLVLSGFALSVDNLVVGFGLGLYQISIVLAIAIIAVVSVGMAAVGL